MTLAGIIDLPSPLIRRLPSRHANRVRVAVMLALMSPTLYAAPATACTIKKGYHAHAQRVARGIIHDVQGYIAEINKSRRLSIKTSTSNGVALFSRGYLLQYKVGCSAVLNPAIEVTNPSDADIKAALDVLGKTSTYLAELAKIAVRTEANEEIQGLLFDALTEVLGIPSSLSSSTVRAELIGQVGNSTWQVDLASVIRQAFVEQIDQSAREAERISKLRKRHVDQHQKEKGDMHRFRAAKAKKNRAIDSSTSALERLRRESRYSEEAADRETTPRSSRSTEARSSKGAAADPEEHGESDERTSPQGFKLDPKSHSENPEVPVIVP